MYLVDTNVWLERLLDQEKSNEVGVFLDQISVEKLYITDFAFHSMGVILNKLKQGEVFVRFVQDVLIDGGIQLIRLEPSDVASLIQTIERFDLDFDDAYQYTVADKYNLTIVSFDSDFDHTDRGKKVPSEVFPN